MLTLTEMRNIATQYNPEIIVDYDFKNPPPNSSAYAGYNIFIGQYEDKELEEISFWHELGHIVSGSNMKRTCFMTKISQEGLAWEVGLELAAQHGRIYDYYDPAIVWARKQLKTYKKGLENWR
jgi:hypothetical protein